MVVHVVLVPRGIKTRLDAMGLPRRVGLSLALAGIDPRAIVTAVIGAPRYLAQFVRYNRLARTSGVATARLSQAVPVLTDASAQAGAGHSEYFLADLHVARLVHAQHPDRHVDVGSRIDGLIAHLLTFVEVEVVDIRPLTSDIPGLRFVQADAASTDGLATEPAMSVSSLHALEHFGLGRYGDKLDPEGHVKGLRSVAALVAPGGWLYIGVPIGRPVTNFNAHRVIAPGVVVDELRHAFDLVGFTAVVDGRLVDDASPDAYADVEWVLGIYQLRRRPAGSSHTLA